MSVVAALRYRPFALLFLGQTVSRLGDAVYTVALAWWVLQATGSATVMGTVLVLTSLPRIFFVLVGGIVVDRVPRALVLFVTDIGRALTVALVAGLALFGILEIWMIYLAGFSFGIFSSFFEPAFVAIVPELVPAQGRPSANSLMALARRLSGIVGPAVGAALVAVGGTSLAFGLNALSFAFAAVMVLPIWRTMPLNAGAQQHSHILTDLRDGWRFVRHTPWLWVSVLIFSVVDPLMWGPFDAVMPLLVKTNLSASVDAYGFIFTATAVGATITALWLGRYRRLAHRGPVFYGAVIVQALTIAGLGLVMSVPAAIAISFVFGIFRSLGNLNWANILQDKVPGSMLGRVAGLDTLISVALTPIGFGLAGWAADWLGAPLVFIGGGAISVVIVALGLLSPAIRNLD